MNAFAQVWGAILPLRWYMACCSGRPRAGCRCTNPRSLSPCSRHWRCSTGCWRSFACAPSGEAWPQASRAGAECGAAQRGIGGAFAAEWRRVLAIPGAFILLVLAPLVYGIYYPQPYLTQILHNVPIASSTTT